MHKYFLLFIALVVALGCNDQSAVSDDSKEAFGTARMELQAAGESGTVYRLEEASFRFVGPTTDETHDADPDEDVLEVDLIPADYFVTLLDGWQMIAVGAGGDEAVEATLVSENPVEIQIVAGEITDVVFLFDVSGELVPFGRGRVSVRIEVSEGELCGNGIVDSGEACDPPDGVGCDAACQLIELTCDVSGEFCPVGSEEACLCGGCNSNGICDDDCVCPDCSSDAFCSDAGRCEDDGVCDPFEEGCICSDCASHPLCLGAEPACGNGDVEPWEECDPPDGVSCNVACQLIDVGSCDVGFANCTVANAETCQCLGCNTDGVCSPDSDDCVCPDCASQPLCANCSTDGVCNPYTEGCDCPDCADQAACSEPACGDSVVDPGEECDPPDGVSCDAACQLIEGAITCDLGDEFELCTVGNEETCECAGCDTDGACDLQDDCVCPDCTSALVCSSCDLDGVCQPFNEECGCPDCAAHPACIDPCRNDPDPACGAGSAPVTGDDFVTVAQGATIEIHVLSNDADVDGDIAVETVAFVSPPLNGMVSVVGDGTVFYVHDGSPTDTDAFSYTVADSFGAVSNVATVFITVTSCGNGDLDPGEECDPPDGVSCDAACQLIEGALRCDFGADLEFCTVGNEETCECAGCDNDGACDLQDDCVCPDCASFPFCSSCDFDGVCQPYSEPCSCADCAAHPACSVPGSEL